MFCRQRFQLRADKFGEIKQPVRPSAISKAIIECFYTKVGSVFRKYRQVVGFHHPESKFGRSPVAADKVGGWIHGVQVSGCRLAQHECNEHSCAAALLPTIYYPLYTTDY